MEEDSSFKHLTGKPTVSDLKEDLGGDGEHNTRIKEIGDHMRNSLDSVQSREYWKSIVNTALDLRAPQTMET